MKIFLISIAGLIFAIIFLMVGITVRGPTPPDPAMVELCERVSAEWMKRQPLIGAERVEVDGAQPDYATLKIRYGGHFDRSQVPAHQRQLLRALLAEMKARGLTLPGFIWIYATVPFVGESGAVHVAYLETAKWDSSSDVVKFETRGE